MTTPTCTCTPQHEADGRYSPSCLRHAQWRCSVSGCPDPASHDGECVVHSRDRLPLSPWGAPWTNGESDRECDRYERGLGL